MCSVLLLGLDIRLLVLGVTTCIIVLQMPDLFRFPLPISTMIFITLKKTLTFFQMCSLPFIYLATIHRVQLKSPKCSPACEIWMNPNQCGQDLSCEKGYKDKNEMRQRVWNICQSDIWLDLCLPACKGLFVC